MEVLPSCEFVSFEVMALKLSKYLRRVVPEICISGTTLRGTGLGNPRSIIYPEWLSMLADRTKALSEFSELPVTS